MTVKKPAAAPSAPAAPAAPVVGVCNSCDGAVDASGVCASCGGATDPKSGDVEMPPAPVAVSADAVCALTARVSELEGALRDVTGAGAGVGMDAVRARLKADADAIRKLAADPAAFLGSLFGGGA